MKRKKLFSRFDAMLLQALIVVLALSLLVGVGVRYYFVQYVNRDCKEQLEYRMLGFENMIQEEKGKSDEQALWRVIRSKLCTTAIFDVYWEMGNEWDPVVSFSLLESRYTYGSAGGAVLLD